MSIIRIFNHPKFRFVEQKEALLCAVQYKLKPPVDG